MPVPIYVNYYSPISTSTPFKPKTYIKLGDI
jgi:hypothetical protein